MVWRNIYIVWESMLQFHSQRSQTQGSFLIKHTRDTKLLRHQDLAKKQIYRVKSLQQNEQLLEVIETFQLMISEDQVMSRCTKCNGNSFRNRCPLKKLLKQQRVSKEYPTAYLTKVWNPGRCMNCHQLHWEGTQYHNAVQKFMEVCKLSHLELIIGGRRHRNRG